MFRRALTQCQILTISQLWDYNVMSAIDLSKAFDKVNHHALFIKLMHRNIPAQILELIENWFNDCCVCVK